MKEVDKKEEGIARTLPVIACFPDFKLGCKSIVVVLALYCPAENTVPFSVVL